MIVAIPSNQVNGFSRFLLGDATQVFLFVAIPSNQVNGFSLLGHDLRYFYRLGRNPF